MRLCRTISSVKKLYVMLSLITSALGWKTIFRKQMLNKIFWDGSINVISTSTLKMQKNEHLVDLEKC